MPRFTEKEKAFISDKLLAEGEKLFSLHGLKKVTVDDLAVAANISKAPFMRFIPARNTCISKSTFNYSRNFLKILKQW